MTRAEFDVWIEANYQKLVNIAVAKVGPNDAEDAVQGALLESLTNRSYERCNTNPITWFMQGVKGRASVARRSLKRIRRVGRAEKFFARAGLVSGRKQPKPNAE